MGPLQIVARHCSIGRTSIEEHCESQDLSEATRRPAHADDHLLVFQFPHIVIAHTACRDRNDAPDQVLACAAKWPAPVRPVAAMSASFCATPSPPRGVRKHPAPPPDKRTRGPAASTCVGDPKLIDRLYLQILRKVRINREPMRRVGCCFKSALANGQQIIAAQNPPDHAFADRNAGALHRLRDAPVAIVALQTRCPAVVPRLQCLRQNQLPSLGRPFPGTPAEIAAYLRYSCHTASLISEPMLGGNTA